MSDTENASLQGIYNDLFYNKIIELTFDTAQQAEKFRIRLAQFKKRADATMTRLGMLQEVQKFSFKVSIQDDGPVIATLQFKDRIEQTFTYRIVEEDPTLEEDPNDD